MAVSGFAGWLKRYVYVDCPSPDHACPMIDRWAIIAVSYYRGERSMNDIRTAQRSSDSPVAYVFRVTSSPNSETGYTFAYSARVLLVRAGKNSLRGASRVEVSERDSLEVALKREMNILRCLAVAMEDAPNHEGHLMELSL